MSAPPISLADAVLLEALAAEEIEFLDAFDHNSDGNLLRGRASQLRARVWKRMRQPRPRTGMVLSYPEIARACGVSHSSIIGSLRRLDAADRALVVGPNAAG